MSLVISLAPVAVALGTLGILSWNGRKAGLATLAVALFLAVTYGPLSQSWEDLTLGLAQSTPTMFMVLFVLFAGLVLYHLQRQAGGLEAIARGIVRLNPRYESQVLILILGVAPAVESVSGFGVGTVVVIPVLIALGIAPLQAAQLGLLSQVAIPWGAMAVGTSYAAELTGMNPGATGSRTALLTLPLPLVYALAALYISGGWLALRRAWPTAVTSGICLSLGLWCFTLIVGLELAGFLASMCVVLLLAAPGLLTRKSTEPMSPGLTRAVLPYFVLVGLLVITRLIPAVQDRLQTLGTLDIQALGLRYTILASPGFCVLVSAIAAVPVLRLGFRNLFQALSQAWRQFVPGAVAIICFLATAQVMRLSGMTSELGTALATLGSGYCFASPWLGALGGWLTGSNTGSNALFARLQFEAATQTGLSPEWLVAGQNAAGSHAAMVSPARTVLASTGAGLDQGESALLRTVGPVILVAEMLLMLILVGVLLWS